jgi:hypothetical protein
MMFGIFLKIENHRAFMEKVSDLNEARTLASVWSAYTTYEVMVVPEPQDVPTCVYRGGIAILCACPAAYDSLSVLGADFCF